MDKTQIAILGDVMFSRELKKNLQFKTKKDFFSDAFLKRMRKYKTIICNLETPLSDSANNAHKDNGFCSPIHSLALLDFVDIFSIANNHIFDQGLSLALSTYHAIKSSGKEVIGFTEKPGFFTPITRNNVAFWACTTKEFTQEKDYAFQKNHIAFIEDEHFRNQVSIFKQENPTFDMLIYYHGGLDYIPHPRQFEEIHYQNLLNLGFNIVVTNHPHVVGGYFEVNGGLVWISLGDLIFDTNIPPRLESVLLEIKEASRPVKWNFQPLIRSKNYQVDFAEGDCAFKIQNKITRNSLIYSGNKKGLLLKMIKAMFDFQISRFFHLIREQGLWLAFKFFISRSRYFFTHFFRLWRK